jgi:hypothetical protein
VGFAHEKKALYFVVIGYADNNKIRAPRVAAKTTSGCGRSPRPTTITAHNKK